MNLQVIANAQIPSLLVCLLLLGCGSKQADPKAVAQHLTTAIPLQSSPSQVINILNGQKIDHSPYLKDAREGNTIRVVIREDRSKLKLIWVDYGVVFRFDDDDHLVGREVSQHLTGP